MQRQPILIAILLVCATNLLAAEPIKIENDGWTCRIATSGDLVSLKNPAVGDLVNPKVGDNLLRVALIPKGKTASDVPAEAMILCNQPNEVIRKDNGASFTYKLAPRLPIKLVYHLSFQPFTNAQFIYRQVEVTFGDSFPKQDLLIVAGNNLALNGKREVFVPQANGIGAKVNEINQRQWFWRLNGEVQLNAEHAQKLAIPMISESVEKSDQRLTHMADPYFASAFQLADPQNKQNGQFNCVFLTSKLMPKKTEVRTFWTALHQGGAKDAFRLWYGLPLADVPEGPDWLHDVAWIHYDYLSHGGKGWFEDIDALTKRIPHSQREKVFFTLHGWYDELGRFTYNEKTGRLDDTWTAFPNADKVKDKGFPTSVSVPMSKAEMHRRIKYAKDSGFRVGVYFADGMTACSGSDFFEEDRVLQWGGWVGPETVGKPYMQNPAHPKVYARHLNYLEAMLDEYGSEIDALVWDETFHVREDVIATGPQPDYASRAMMRLVRDCTKLVTEKCPQVAMLTSDDQGLTSNHDDSKRWLNVPPYAIMSHGTYQDSHCEPSTWAWGIFSNLRNVLWSCNWQAVTHLDYTAFGVEHYQTPVVTTNGWLDDKGIARLNNDELQAVMKLWNKRKNQRQELHWLTGSAPVFKPEEW